MTIALQNFTPTQVEAVSRRKAFRARIARKAAELKAKRDRQAITEFDRRVTPPVMAIEPEAFPAEPDPPGFAPSMIWPAFVAPAPDRRFIRVAEVQAVVCGYFSYLTIRDLKSVDRTLPVVVPRQIGMYLSKHFTNSSYPQIGRMFGNRDHTTVLHGVRKIAALIKTDESVAFDVASLTEMITGFKQ